jgi:non-ribosomal peptide synthetase component F
MLRQDGTIVPAMRTCLCVETAKGIRPSLTSVGLSSDGVFLQRGVVAEEIASSIVDYLAIHAEESLEKTAVVCDARELSFGDLDNLSARCRRVFKDFGLERGDRVALIMCDCPQWVVAFLGAIGLGAIAASCSTMLSAAEARPRRWRGAPVSVHQQWACKLRPVRAGRPDYATADSLEIIVPMFSSPYCGRHGWPPLSPSPPRRHLAKPPPL